MPRGDGTGPEGKGSRTGRGLGNCPPNTTQTSTPTVVGGRRSRGKGRGIRGGINGGRGLGRRKA